MLLTRNRIGRYFIESPIRRTNLSRVYLGRDAKSSSPVVVKKYNLKKAKQRRSYKRETYALSQTDYPSIIRMHDFFTRGNDGYIILEYIEGCSLERMIKLHGGLSETDAAYVGCRLAEALHNLHDRLDPLLHRDVKPGNVMVRDDGRIVLIDFNMSGHRTNKIYFGSDGYHSPESHDCKEQDTPSDIYSYGFTLLDAITTEDPCKYSHPVRFFNEEDLRQMNVDISHPIICEIRKCLSIHPEERPSALQLAHRMESLYVGLY